MIAAVLGRCALALVLFFVLHGIGLVVAGYAVFYAFQLKAAGSKYGTFALIATISTFVVIGLGWFLRIGSGWR
ncbi:MAG: hypothetical protein JSS65_01280 [Armatimonadetes bacterium]|nr:hypothetical protein [Armatimonadota bacterium]